MTATVTFQAVCRHSFIAAAGLLVAVAGSALRAQNPADLSDPSKLAFEVASIKRNPSVTDFMRISTNQGRYVATNVSPRMLMAIR